MAILSMTIPDSIAPRVAEAFAAAYNYQGQIPDPAHPGQYIPNPVSKAQFVKLCVKIYLAQVTIEYEAKQAALAAEQAARNQGADEINIGD